MVSKARPLFAKFIIYLFTFCHYDNFSTSLQRLYCDILGFFFQVLCVFSQPFFFFYVQIENAHKNRLMETQQVTKGLNENAGMAVNRQRGRRVKLRATSTTLKFSSSPPECLRAGVCPSECASHICITMIAISACQMLGKIYSACLIYQPSPLPLRTLCIMRASSPPFPASPPAFLPFSLCS